VRGTPPALDLARAEALNRLLPEIIAKGLVQSAHDCSDGGLAVALAECCFDSGGLGAAIAVEAVERVDGLDGMAVTLFGESASRVLLGVAEEHLDAVLAAARAAGVRAARIGRTGGDRIRVHVDGALAIDCTVAEAETPWATALATWMDSTAV
jgi:phosphoribosylformylglycinamidine synthase